MELGLKGKRVLITGATRGIGREIAETMLAEGAQVAFCARSSEAVEEAISALSPKGRVIGRAVNVADTAALKTWIDDAAAELCGLDVFVSNVSVGGGPEKWQAAYEVDVMGTVRGCEAVIPHLERSGGGAIVLISTTAASEVWRAPQAYAVVKSGLMNYAKNLADHVAAANIRVNTVSPGPVYFPGSPWVGIEQQLPEFFASVLASIPMKRLATPADIARAVTFLVSDAAEYITGITVTVDGGRTRKVDY